MLGSVAAKARESIAVTVLLPTPPFPDKISILWRTTSKCLRMISTAGSSPLVAPEAHIFWFGQPAHDEAFPAFSLSVPGQSIE